MQEDYRRIDRCSDKAHYDQKNNDNEQRNKEADASFSFAYFIDKRHIADLEHHIDDAGKNGCDTDYEKSNPHI